MINIGTKRQLLMDERFIVEAKNISMKVHKPAKTGEKCISIENSSHRRIGGYSSVAYHDGIYSIWYGENSYKADGIYICVKYAQSNDGINWELPNLGWHPTIQGNQTMLSLGLEQAELKVDWGWNMYGFP